MTDKTDVYYLHQTPMELAKDLIPLCPIEPGDILYEPFRGEGAFYNHFPNKNPKMWSEITEGRDYKEHNESFDWVITNPPFCLDVEAKRVNAFWFLLDYYSQRANKGIAFLANDTCFSTLTPKRMELLQNRGWYIKKVVICSIKKWRGRYFFIILTKEPSSLISYLRTSY